MKTIVFSDTHLDKHFDQKKFNFLEKIISSADQVIINGDFWEGFDMSFGEFIKSPWNKLFPLMKNKTIYIYGNHDDRKLSNKKVSLFSKKQAKQYKLQIGDKTFFFEHGDRLVPLADYFFDRYLRILPPTWINQGYEKFEGLMIKLFGKKYLQLTYAQFNRTMKTDMKNYAKNNHYYVFGHTHLAEYDKQNRYANCGIIRHGLGQYIEIDGAGNITLKEERF